MPCKQQKLQTASVAPPRKRKEERNECEPRSFYDEVSLHLAPKIEVALHTSPYYSQPAVPSLLASTPMILLHIFLLIDAPTKIIQQ